MVGMTAAGIIVAAGMLRNVVVTGVTVTGMMRGVCILAVEAGEHAKRRSHALQRHDRNRHQQDDFPQPGHGNSVAENEGEPQLPLQDLGRRHELRTSRPLRIISGNIYP